VAGGGKPGDARHIRRGHGASGRYDDPGPLIRGPSALPGPSGTGKLGYKNVSLQPSAGLDCGCDVVQVTSAK